MLYLPLLDFLEKDFFLDSVNLVNLSHLILVNKCELSIGKLLVGGKPGDEFSSYEITISRC